MNATVAGQHSQVRAGDIRPGKNPRKHFPEAEQKELEESIRAQGLIQYPVIRPVNDGFELVAGERRWRAFSTVFGEDALMDVIIRQLSDEQAEVMAIVENVDRLNMSPTEEAESAHRVLIRLRDKQEVAAEFGWPLSKLERRLALMRCSPRVRQYLTERKIMLGHAELLAALAEDKQDLAVEKVIEANLSVADLRKSLCNLAQKLEEAVFDKKDCLNCNHNSSTQAALFTENIGDGSCTHPTCFRDKTDAHLNAVKSQLEREVNRVEFLEPGDEKVIPIKLVADGAKGVGAEQFQACKGCASCGATISKMPAEVGKIEKGICFEASCHTVKVAEHLKSIAESAAQPGASSSNKTSKSTASTKPAAAAKPGEFRAPIKEYVEKFLRGVAAREVARNQEQAEQVFIWMALTGQTRHIPSAQFANAYKSVTGVEASSSTKLDQVAKTLSALDVDKPKRLIAAAAAYAMNDSGFQLGNVKQVLQLLNVDLSTKWKVDEEFLNLLTKAEIEAFLQSSGLKGHLGDEATKKLLNNKKDDVIKGILAHADGFLAGKVHEAISYAK
ncbi:PRTRC system ParB family protein [Crenobacter sp. SG2305]|uniref:PRTRC system ParB family protein n=1 Tax=Crenobacter oryzisoli TaxID=3056844 RepID=UPI0025AAC3DF|nr:PRTRC system ParB family protein [Crenobacter sp. SG2305]MDN0082353.1 PRTRC system ParB family protein [Crenobacter sp. SG2305]